MDKYINNLKNIRYSDKLVKICIAVILAFSSFFIAGKYASSPTSSFNNYTIEYLEGNHQNVLALTATAAGLSAAITLIPGDAGTPIAEKLADFGTYFMIIMSAIFLEKYLLIVLGNLAFKALIPIACIFYIIYLHNDNYSFMKTAIKIFALGLSLYLVIPSSVFVSHIIEDTYHVSIQETIDQAQETTTEIQNNQDNESKLMKIYNKITNSGSELKEEAGNLINNYVEAFAIMLVISCIFPVLILLFFVWIIKIILGIQSKPKVFHHMHEHNK